MNKLLAAAHQLGTKPGRSRCLDLMTNLQTVTKKILQPVVLAIAMLFLTPVAELLQAALMTPVPVQTISNETIVYKSVRSSIAFKG